MKKLRTLIVEHDDRDLQDLRRYLSHEACASLVEAKTVGTYSDAVTTLLTERFDVSIIDIELPEGELGFRLLDRGMADDLGMVIFCSGHGRDHYLKVLNLEYLWFIEKPLSLEKIQRMMLEIKRELQRRETPIEYIALFESNSAAKKFLVKKKDIFYIEYKNENCTFYYKTEEGISKEHKIKMELADLISRDRLSDRFLKFNRTGILNIDHFNTYRIDDETIIATMPNGKEIQITRNFKDEILERKGIS